MISTQTTVETLSMVRKRHATIFYIGLFHVYQIWPEKLTLQNFWCHFRFQMSIWWTKRWGVPCNGIRICKLSFRPSIKILKLSVTRVWTQQNSRRRLLNSSKRKSNSWPRSTCSKTEETHKISRPFSKQLLNLERSRRMTPVSMRKSGNSVKW